MKPSRGNLQKNACDPKKVYERLRDWIGAPSGGQELNDVRDGSGIPYNTLRSWKLGTAFPQLKKVTAACERKGTVATRLLRRGVDLATVGDILGHKPPYRTTLRYTAHTTEDRKREALGKLRSNEKPILRVIGKGKPT